MKYSFGVSTLLAASVAATYVDISGKPIYHTRDIQTDSDLRIRQTDDFSTTILRRSPPISGGSMVKAQSPSRTPPKSPQGAEAKNKSGASSSKPKESSPSRSSSSSPVRGASPSGGGGSKSPKSGHSSPKEGSSYQNPFETAAEKPLRSENSKAFPKGGTRFEGTGTLKPQSRRGQRVPEGRGFGNIPGRSFGGPSQEPSSRGTSQQQVWSGIGRPRIGSSGAFTSGIRPAAEHTISRTSSGNGGQSSNAKGGRTSVKDDSDTGQQGSQSGGSSGMERRSIENEEVPAYFARSLGALYMNNIYTRSLGDTQPIWKRNIAKGKTLLQARTSPPPKIKIGVGGDGNPTRIRTSGTTASTTTPSRGNSENTPQRGNSPPQAESPQRARLQRTSPPPRSSLEGHFGHTTNGRGVRTLGSQSNWPVGITPPRSILRQGSANSSGGGQHVRFANPIETQILSSRVDFSRSPSADSLGSTET